MSYPVLLASSALAVILVLALAREMRLRRALQRLLARLLKFWRKQHAENPPTGPTDDDDSGPIHPFELGVQ